MIFLGEGSLRRAMAEVETFYSQERSHQGLENAMILSESDELLGQGAIECPSRLGGILNYYYREAA